MGQIAAEALIERLADWGVDTVFGLPGDGINGIMEGLRRHHDADCRAGQRRAHGHAPGRTAGQRQAGPE
jgi:Thiamine pyrophosphate enzyme, N-terminal TPP binding domain